MALYLVLFTHDKSFNNLASKIQQATENYAEAFEFNSNLDYQALDSNQSENRFCFSLTEPRNRFGFANKTRVIHVVLCNLEVDHQSKSKDRQQRAKKSRG